MPVTASKQKGFRVPAKMHRFKSWDEFWAWCERNGGFPGGLVSPGYIAGKFGITRQSVHAACWAGHVEVFYIQGGYVLLSEKSCDAYWKRV